LYDKYWGRRDDNTIFDICYGLLYYKEREIANVEMKKES
jgi:hypothetical protein